MSASPLFNGLPILVNENCMEKERLFPVSKNRSRRIWKKLMKRFGGEFKMVPAARRIPYGYVMHPEIYEKFKQEVSKP